MWVLSQFLLLQAQNVAVRRGEIFTVQGQWTWKQKNWREDSQRMSQKYDSHLWDIIVVTSFIWRHHRFRNAFFLSRSFNYVIAYCYVNQQHSDRLVSGINCDGVSFGDSFSTFGIRTSSTIYYHDWVCTFHFRWLKNEHPIGYRYSRKNTCKPPEGDHTPNRFKMSVWQPYL